MLINLKNLAKNNEQQKQNLELSTRLPRHLKSPCMVQCQYSVKNFNDYYLVNLKSEADLKLTCQRCLVEFSHHYENQTELAICHSEAIAEKMMHRFDCIVAGEEIDLQDLLTDELNLFAPEFHSDLEACDQEIEHFINS